MLGRGTNSGFATAPLVVEGCIMMRKCHLKHVPGRRGDSGPAVAQSASPASPEHVVNYFFFVAEEVRELMAKLGFRTFDEMIGRADLLDMKPGIEHWKGGAASISRACSTR